MTLFMISPSLPSRESSGFYLFAHWVHRRGEAPGRGGRNHRRTPLRVSVSVLSLSFNIISQETTHKARCGGRREMLQDSEQAGARVHCLSFSFELHCLPPLPPPHHDTRNSHSN